VDNKRPIGISMTTGNLVYLDEYKPTVNWIKYSGGIQMQKCPTCETELPEDHSAFDMQALKKFVESKGGWDRFEAGAYNFIGKNFTLANGKTAEIVKAKTTYDTGDIGDSYSYYGGDSPLPQGSEFETYVIVKVGEAFFKKTGHGDSYGEVNWDGDLVRVQAKTKVVTVYDFE
jgi:hypothetical protein